MKKLEFRNINFRVESVDEKSGTFTGYASIWNSEDAYKDVIQKGAFKKTLRDNKKFWMLWSHWVMEPIGLIGGKEDDKGLFVEGELNLGVKRAVETYELMKQARESGIPMGLSIGFETLNAEFDKGTGIRTVKEIKLWEISVCIFPAQPLAGITDVRSMSPFQLTIRDMGLASMFGAKISTDELNSCPNEHAVKLLDPGAFDEFRRKGAGKINNTIDVPATVSQIRGHLKDGEDDDWSTQALRFPSKDWTEEEARAWLTENEVKYIAFEAAKEPDKSTHDVKPEIIHLMAETKDELEKLVASLS